MSQRDTNAISRFIAVNKGVHPRGFIQGCHTFVGDSGSVIYSYGHHFPLMVFTNENKFIINGDKYSNTTTSHTNACISKHRDIVGSEASCIPFTALRECLPREKGHTEEIKDITLIEVSDPSYKPIKRRLSKKKYTKEDITDSEELEIIGEKSNVWIVKAKEHVLGYTLFKHENRYFLSGMDDNHYFICELLKQCQTVKEALRSMAKNLNNEQWTQYLKGDIQRQGELFFIPLNGVSKDIEARYKKANIESRNVHISLGTDTTNHTANKVFYSHDGNYAKGRVSHARGDHKSLMLYQWHRVVLNTVKNSWTASGRVD